MRVRACACVCVRVCAHAILLYAKKKFLKTSEERDNFFLTKSVKRLTRIYILWRQRKRIDFYQNANKLLDWGCQGTKGNLVPPPVVNDMARNKPR